MRKLSEKNATNGVIESAIENWLTNSSERSIQSAYCQLLNAKGYTVIHSTTHGPMEEGKDVIAIAPNKRIVAIQLKRGNITVNDWRKIRSEIEELVEYEVKHPSVPKNKRHYPILVTTGSINENTWSRIKSENKNWTRRGFRALEVQTHSFLLKDFIDNIKSFMPQPMSDFHRLLGFMINEGKGCLDKEEFHLLLDSLFRFDKKTRKTEIKRTISSAAIIVEYAISGFDSAKNYFPKIEAYVMFFSHINALRIKYKLKNCDYLPVLELFESAIDSILKDLFDEVVKFDGLDMDDPFTEPITRPYRSTILIGLLSAHWLWCSLGGNSTWLDEHSGRLEKIILELLQYAKIPSETFIPHLYLCHLFLRNNGYPKESNQLFKGIIECSIYGKQEDAIKPLWDCYVSFEESILTDLGIKQDLFETRWECQSYTLLPLILIAASYLMKQDLESHWYSISHLHFMEYIPEQSYKYLFWKNDTGSTKTRIMNQPTSWKKLLSESQSYYKRPPLFNDQMAKWLPYYLLVYPHRFNSHFVFGLQYLLATHLKTKT